MRAVLVALREDLGTPSEKLDPIVLHGDSFSHPTCAVSSPTRLSEVGLKFLYSHTK